MISVKVQTPPPWVVLMLALFGTVALTLALRSGLASWRLTRDGVRTTGTVVKLSKRTATDSGDMSDSSAPTFRFRDAAGTEHTVQSHFSQSPPAHRVGDVVPVIYPPTAPDEARIAKFSYLWLLPTIAGGVAAVFLSIMLLTVWRSVSGRRG